MGETMKLGGRGCNVRVCGACPVRDPSTRQVRTEVTKGTEEGRFCRRRVWMGCCAWGWSRLDLRCCVGHERQGLSTPLQTFTSPLSNIPQSGIGFGLPDPNVRVAQALLFRKAERVFTRRSRRARKKISSGQERGSRFLRWGRSGERERRRGRGFGGLHQGPRIAPRTRFTIRMTNAAMREGNTGSLARRRKQKKTHTGHKKSATKGPTIGATAKPMIMNPITVTTAISKVFCIFSFPEFPGKRESSAKTTRALIRIRMITETVSWLGLELPCLFCVIFAREMVVAASDHVIPGLAPVGFVYHPIGGSKH